MNNKYSGNSHLVIDMLIAERLGYQVKIENKSVWVFSSLFDMWHIFNPTNNDADGMPLAWDEWMSIESYSGEYDVRVDGKDNHGETYTICSAYSVNPLRAICECYLLMRDMYEQEYRSTTS